MSIHGRYMATFGEIFSFVKLIQTTNHHHLSLMYLFKDFLVVLVHCAIVLQTVMVYRLFNSLLYFMSIGGIQGDYESGDVYFMSIASCSTGGKLIYSCLFSFPITIQRQIIDFTIPLFI